MKVQVKNLWTNGLLIPSFILLSSLDVGELFITRHNLIITRNVLRNVIFVMIFRSHSSYIETILTILGFKKQEFTEKGKCHALKRPNSTDINWKSHHT